MEGRSDAFIHGNPLAGFRPCMAAGEPGLSTRHKGCPETVSGVRRPLPLNLMPLVCITGTLDADVRLRIAFAVALLNRWPDTAKQNKKTCNPGRTRK